MRTKSYAENTIPTNVTNVEETITESTMPIRFTEPIVDATRGDTAATETPTKKEIHYFSMRSSSYTAVKDTASDESSLTAM